MTQEEKELLLKDLCGRLPYEVILHIEDDSGNIIDEELDSINLQFNEINVEYHLFTDVIQPYLRPLSSMTEEEVKTFKQLQKDADEAGTFEDDMLLYDWLNKKHFDYRLLIFQGLALEAPEGMYKTE